MKSNLKLLIVLILAVQLNNCQHENLSTEYQIISQQEVVFCEPPERIPVQYSVDAPLLGNGYTGVAISGNPEKQVYYFARNDFWRLKSSYNESFPAVLGKMEIDIPYLKDASYLIDQELYDAQTFSKFSKGGKNVIFKTFVSATEDIMVVEISLSGEGELEGIINLELPGDKELQEKWSFKVVTDKGKTPDGIIYISRGFQEDVDIPTKASCALKIIGNKSNEFKLSQKKPINVVVAFSSNFKSDDCLQTVIQKVTDFKNGDLEKTESKHEQWWRNYWSKSYVEINDTLLEKLYYLSNYNLASFSRDKDFPPGIFGTCVTKEIPYWSGDYHLNYNHVAPFYGLFSSNHIEQAIPCNIALLAQQERGEYYSKKVCGIEGGILLPVGAGPLGIETTRKNEYLVKNRVSYLNDGNVEDEGLFFGQKSNSSYSIVNMAMHFYTTYDKEYTELYYPFVKGVATFWEIYLTLENGRYVIYNDAIHEGTIGNKNPILSLGLIRLVMQTAIDMSKELDVDAERIEKWQHVMDHLPDYTYQERDGKKVFRYTEKGPDWYSSNTLGIQHIYPCGQIGLESDPALLEVARNTIEVMHRWSDSNGTNSFFPAAVRVGYNTDSILNNLHKYAINTYPNGFRLNNPHGIENFSTVPNTINEMLCMGHGDLLRVFPVWPKEKAARFYNLRTYGAFLVSSELKDGEVLYVNIVSEKGKPCRFKNPWSDQKVSIKSNISEIKEMSGNILEIETKKGEEILLKPI